MTHHSSCIHTETDVKKEKTGLVSQPLQTKKTGKIAQWFEFRVPSEPFLFRMVPKQIDLASQFSGARISFFQTLSQTLSFKKYPELSIFGGELNYGEVCQRRIRVDDQVADVTRQMMIKNPSIIDLLLARPMILSKLVRNQGACQVLKNVLIDIITKGVDAIINAGINMPIPTPLNPIQRKISEGIAQQAWRKRSSQGNFNFARKDDLEYVDRYVDNLYQQAEGAINELKPLTRKLAKTTRGKAGFRPKPKDRKRVMDKIEGYDNDASQVTDLAGSKIVYRSLDDLYRGLAQTQEVLGNRIVQIKDRFIKPQSSGYRDILMNIEMSNGHISEFRLHLAQIDKVAEIEHDLYVLSRSLGPTGTETQQILTKEERALLFSLEKETQRLFETALQEATQK